MLLASLSASAGVVAKVTDFALSGAMRTVQSLEVANPRIYLTPYIDMTCYDRLVGTGGNGL